jgi:hypothetical protein
MHAELEKLSSSTTNAGYMPDTQFAPHDVDKEEKVSHLCQDNEKLSIVLGSSAHLLVLRFCIFKNLLQVCVDHHITTKFIAKIVGRAIW